MALVSFDLVAGPLHITPCNLKQYQPKKKSGLAYKKI
jgi:hypothetical protein